MARLARFIDVIHRLKRRHVRRSGSPSGLLIVAAGGLGDTVLFSLVLPRVATLARAGEKVTVLLRRDGAATAFLFAPAVEVLVVDFARFGTDVLYRWRQLDLIFRRHFRLALSMDMLRHPHLDEALLFAAAAPTLGMEPRPWAKYDRLLRANRRFYDRLFDSGPVHLDKLVRWSRFADWLTGDTAPPPKVSLPADRLPAPAGDGDVVVIQPFSAMAQKQPSAAVFRRLIEAVPAGMTVLITGAAGDLRRNPDYAGLLDLPSVRFDDSPFDRLAATLRAARLVISVDTAVMHLAVALGAPTLCLASAAYVGEIVPYAEEVMPDNVRFFFHDMPCRGCLGNCSQPFEDGRFACVNRLDMGPVLDEVRRVLAA